MDKPTRLYRGDSYPYEQENPSYYEAIKTRNGEYSVTIDLMTDAFILTNPAGKLVEDSFHNFHKRKDLYDNYNDAVYEWLVMVGNVPICTLALKSGLIACYLVTCVFTVARIITGIYS